MIKFTLTDAVRVRTSSGEAMFTIPGTGVVLEADQQFAGKWITLPEGSEVLLCAKFEKTDTFMLAVTQPALVDEDSGEEVIPALTNGFVLRKLGFEAVLAKADFEEEAEVTDLVVAAEA